MQQSFQLSYQTIDGINDYNFMKKKRPPQMANNLQQHLLMRPDLKQEVGKIGSAQVVTKMSTSSVPNNQTPFKVVN